MEGERINGRGRPNCIIFEVFSQTQSKVLCTVSFCLLCKSHEMVENQTDLDTELIRLSWMMMLHVC